MSDSPNRDLVVFSEAIDLTAAERAAFLERACSGDEALRQRVEALLQTHDRIGDFLEQSIHPTAAEARTGAFTGEKPGDRIGRYKLLQQIGEGGCGIVYMAEQETPVRRRIALKIIKPGMDTKNVITRFEAERQALALMDHPNIAKVFDAGATESGRPYFVMELVRGIKITEYCDQNALTTEERLKLFIQVCRAVQHAHQKGVIHRDIKPSNILVTTSFEGVALPVVIDFGIAKATTNQQLTDKTLFTAFEMFIGTPAYMSPEQAALSNFDVDTRTDIYSLGVLLYELLTGSTPFDVDELMKTGLDEIRRVIREEEPVCPSTRLSKLNGKELTTVAQHRKSEPPKLIRTVRGDLDWIAMKALEKDRTRRYETANGLAVDIQNYLANEAVLARPPSTIYKLQKIVWRNKLLFAGISLIAVLLVLSLALVSASLAKERQARREAQTEAAKSRQVTHFLENMLRGVGPSAAQGRDTTMLREILDKTADQVSKELIGQPAVEAELRGLIGQVLEEVGEHEQAEKMDRSALALNQKLFGSENLDTAASLNNLGLVLWREGKLDEAEQMSLKALAIRRHLLGETNSEVATTINNLANVYRVQRRLPEAEALTQQALGIRRKLFGNESLEVADSLRHLSIVLADEGKPVEAEAVAREVLAIRQRLLQSNDRLLASSLDDVAWAAGLNGKHDEAESLERQSLEIKRKILGDTHPDVAKSIFLIGERLAQRGKLTDSDAVLNAALSIQLKLLGENSPDTLYTLRRLAWTYESEGKWPEAELTHRESLKIWRQRAGAEGSDTLLAAEGLARALINQNKFDEARQILNEMLTPSLIKNPASVDLLILRQDLLGRQGYWQEAANDATLVVKYQPTDHYWHHILAGLLAITHDRAEYEPFCQQTLAQFTNTTNPYIAERVASDCLILPHSGADLHLVDQLANVAVAGGTNNAGGLPWFQVAKAHSSYRLGHFAEAIDWATKSLINSDDCVKAHAYAIQAMAYWQLGQVEAAQAALAKGTSLAPGKSNDQPPKNIGSQWAAWIFAWVSLDEATTLIQPVATIGNSAKVIKN
ncbi:MAG TPA: tetratricopeptide repeat protein [Verrucomicrobiae bacterium]|jgi:serine/threonine protein kinase